MVVYIYIFKGFVREFIKEYFSKRVGWELRVVYCRYYKWVRYVSVEWEWLEGRALFERVLK